MPLTVEDALELVAINLSPSTASEVDRYMKDEWQKNFTINVFSHVRMGRPLSTEQARIVLRIIDRCRSYLADRVNIAEVDRLLVNPVYRQPPYPSVRVPREVRWLGQNKLAFRFKRDDVLTNKLKALSAARETPHAEQVVFKRDEKLWIVPVNRDNIQAVVDVIGEHRFHFDRDVEEFLLVSLNSRGGTSACLLDPEAGEILINTVDNDLLSMWAETILFGRPV